MALCFDVKHRANGQSSPSLLAINNDFTLVRQNLCVAANPRFLSLKHQYGALHTESAPYWCSNSHVLSY